EDGIRDATVTGVQTCALPILAGLEDAADEVLAMARACLSSPALARALAADELWREVPYTLRVPTGYATGRMDVVIREGDRLAVRSEERRVGGGCGAWRCGGEV